VKRILRVQFPSRRSNDASSLVSFPSRGRRHCSRAGNFVWPFADRSAHSAACGHTGRAKCLPSSVARLWLCTGSRRGVFGSNSPIRVDASLCRRRVACRATAVVDPLRVLRSTLRSFSEILALQSDLLHLSIALYLGVDSTPQIAGCWLWHLFL